MKKIKIVFLGIIIFLGIFATRANASNGSLSLAGDTELKKGETGSCTLSFTSDSEVGNIEMTLSLKNIVIDQNSGLVGMNGWNPTFNAENGKITVLKPAGSNGELILKIYFTVLDNAVGDAYLKINDEVVFANTDYSSFNVLGVTHNITIKPDEVENVKKLEGISIKQNPSKTVYVEGDFFNKTGMKVVASYSDGTEKEIENYTVIPSQQLNINDKEVKVSYSEGDITRSTTVSIVVNKKAENNTNDEQKPGGTEDSKPDDEQKPEGTEDSKPGEKEDSELDDEQKPGEKEDSEPTPIQTPTLKPEDNTNAPSDLPVTGTGKVIAGGIASVCVVLLVSYVMSKREG